MLSASVHVIKYSFGAANCAEGDRSRVQSDDIYELEISVGESSETKEKRKYQLTREILDRLRELIPINTSTVE